MGKSLASVRLLTKNHKKIMKLVQSSLLHHCKKQYKFFQTKVAKPKESFLTFGETPSYVVYGWPSVLSHAQHILNSAGESDCN